MNTSAKISLETKESLLTRLARDGLMKNVIASVAGSTLYAVSEGWQLRYLKDAQEITETLDSEAFEAAVQNPDVGAIFVPKSAAITREIAERISTRNGQPKTIFWEA